MGNKISIGIIVLAVCTVMYFMVSIVKDFNDASAARVDLQKSNRDSALAAQIQTLQSQDSALSFLIQEQFVRTEAMARDINNLKYRLNELSRQAEAHIINE